MQFLQKVAESLPIEKLPDWSDILVIFPNRRSIVFFKKILKERFPGQTIILPKIVELNDWIIDLTGMEKTDKAEAELFLYQAFIESDVPEDLKNFDRFLSRAPKIINDFNEIDKQCHDVEKVFSEYAKYREIDLKFSTHQQSEYEWHYLQLLQTIPSIYSKWLDLLVSHNKTYEGFAYKYVAQHLTEIAPRFSKIIIAGFNALSISEQIIFKHLEENFDTQIFWDVDAYYFEDTYHEAGYFLRKNDQLFKNKPSLQLQKNFEKSKNFYIYPLSGVYEQLSALKHNIATHTHENTLIIFADESMILPFLNFVRQNDPDFNITHGLPLNQGDIFFLYQQCLEFIKLIHQNGHLIYLPVVKNYIHNPFIQWLNPGLAERITENFKQNQNLLIPKTEFLNFFSDQSFANLLTNENLPWNDLFSILHRWESVMHELYNKQDDLAGENTFKINEWNLLHEILQKIYQISRQWPGLFSIKHLERYFNHYVVAEFLPLTGEPLTGMQIMGILESRNLAFDNVHIVGCNDEFLPGKQHLSTTLISEIRKRFSLPSLFESQAVMAYHFYRIIQHAQSIYLYYNDTTENINSSGPSRYLMQLEYELCRQNPHIQFQKVNYHLPAPTFFSQQKEIKNSPQAIQQIKSWMQTKVSPSALISFLKCPLDFYYKYVLDMKDSKDETVFAPNIWGTIVHQIMEKLYTPFHTKKILPKNLSQFITAEYIDKTIDEIFQKNGFNTRIGYFAVMKHALSIQIKKIVEIDEERINRSPENIVYIGSEYRIITNLNFGTYSIKTFCIADRIEKTGNTYHIIDYKTSTTIKNKVDFDKIENSEHAFQLLFYAKAFATQNKLKENESIILNIYSLQKNVQQTIIEVNDETMNYFETKVSEIFSSLLDPSYVFRHQPKAPNCNFCNN